MGVAILPLLGIRDFITLWKQDRFEFVVGAACFLVTLFIGAIPGILVAFVLALVNLARRAANPAIDVLASTGEPTDSLLLEAPKGAVTAPGVVVVRLAAPLFFANSTVFGDAVKRAVGAADAAGHEHVRHVVIDMEAVTDVDVTGAESFEVLLAWLDARDIDLGFSRVRPDARARLTELGLLGDRSVYDTNRAAIADLTNSNV